MLQKVTYLSKGCFEVLEFIKGEYGEIQSLFLVHNDKGEILEGAIRFNSIEVSVISEY
jgi:hypothetical protein